LLADIVGAITGHQDFLVARQGQQVVFVFQQDQ